MKKTTVIFILASILLCSLCTAYAKTSSLNAADIIADRGNTDLLVKYNIVTADDLKKDGYITEREALNIFSVLLNGEYAYKADDIKRWYLYDCFAPLDDIPDEDKALFLSLIYGSKNPVLRPDEVPGLDLEKKLTTQHTLLYTIRLIGDTYGCTDYPEELEYTEVSQIYGKAFEKGLITKTINIGAEVPITRGDFYALLSHAATLDSNVGSYSPDIYSLEDTLERREQYKKEREEKPKLKLHEEKITADVTLNKDMSLSWSLNDDELNAYDYRKVIESNYEEWVSMPFNDWDIKIYSYDTNGEVIHGISTTYLDAQSSNFIPTREMIQYVYGDAPADHITVTYGKYDDPDWTERTEKSFDIDISDIKWVTEGKPLKPGVFQTFAHQWVPYKISLDGEKLKKDSYYMLTSYDHSYRLPELNRRDICLFDVERDTDAFVDEDDSYDWMTGGIEIEDVHISRVRITGDPQKGFTLHITPESEAFAEYPDHPIAY